MGLWGYDVQSDVHVMSSSPRSTKRSGASSAAAFVLVMLALARHLPASAQDAPHGDAPAKGNPPPAAATKDAPTQASPAQPAPAKGAPASAEGTKDTSAQAAAATAASGDDAERARELFREGLVLVDEERWPAAAEHFRRVLAIRWSAAAAHNLGSALVELGKLVEASEHLRRVIEDETAAPAIRAAAQRMVEAIEPQIGELSIQLVGDAEGLALVLDERALPSDATTKPVRIDPGYHVVAALRGGVVVAREEIYLGSGARTIAVELDPARPPPEFELPVGALAPPFVAAPSRGAPGLPPVATSPRPDVRRDAPEPWWAWVGGGVVVTGLVTAAIVLIATQGEGQPEPLPGDLDPRVLRGRVGPP